MSALNNYHQALEKIAVLDAKRDGLTQRITEAQSKVVEATASTSQVNALKGQRRKIWGLSYLGQTKETTTTLDLQISEAEKTAEQQVRIIEGAMSASEILTEQAHKVWLESDALRKNLPELKYLAAVDIAEGKAAKYQECAETFFLAYAEMTGTARLANSLSDPVNGVPAIEGAFALSHIVELPIVSGLKSFAGFHARRDLTEIIDGAKSKILAELESKNG